MFAFFPWVGGSLGPQLLFALILCWCHPPVRVYGAEAGRRPFAILAADAEVTLQQFSQEAGTQLVYLLDDVRGIRTNTVKGTFATGEALQRLVANTGLTVVKDEKTGAFVVKRVRPVPPRHKGPQGKSSTTTDPMKLTPKSWLRAAALAIAYWPADALSQQAAAASGANNDTVTLSPFIIEDKQDTGYRKLNAVTATRIGTNILDTPLNIQVLSREFLDDLYVENLNKAFDYAAGVKTSYDSNVRNTGSIRIRGMPTDVVYRDGFRKFASFHMDGVDRIEVVKGPASLFFGRAEPGGIINYASKKPQFVNAGIVQATVGNDSYLKGLLDYQHTLLDKKAAFRVVTSKRDSDDWIEYTHWNEGYVQGSIALRPLPGLQLNVGYEHANQQRDGGPVPALVANLDYMADYEAGRLRTGPNGLPETTAAWRERKFLETGVYPSQWTGYWFPRGFNWNRNGPGSFENAITDVYEAQVYWTIAKNLDLRVGATRQHADYETSWFINQDPHQSPSAFNNAAPTPYYVNYGFLIAPAWRGTGYNVPGSQADVNKVDSLQADLSYRFSAFNANHTVIGSFEYIDNHFRQFGFLLNEEKFRAAGGLVGDFAAPPGVPNWEFFPGAFGVLFRDVTQPNFTPPNLRDFLGARSGSVNSGTSSSAIERAVSFAYQGSWFRDRLKLLAGARQTWFATVPVDNNGRMVAQRGWAKSDDLTPTVGANFYLTPNWIVYGSYSQSFRPTTVRNPSYINRRTNETLGGNQLDNEVGEGFELGLKTQAFGNKLTGTLSVFRLDRDQIVLNDSVTNTRMDTENRAGTAQWVDAATGSAQFGLRRNSGLHRTEGVETDLVWTPDRNLQVLLGYSYMWKRDVVTDDPSVINVRNGGLYNPPFNDGRNANWSTLAQVPAHLFSLWTKYTFTEGRLKGLSVGLGGNYESESPGSQDRVERAWIAGDFWKMDALLSYTARVAKRPLTFQLNVDNVLDKEYITGSFGLAPTRTWRLTTRYAF